jgi:hypothetical protein
MRTVDDFFASAVQQTLYHYTGVGALLGIVDIRTLWASHVYYLSDSKEILHACAVLSEVLAHKADDYHGEEREFITQFRQWLSTFHTVPYHLFIFSLSEEKSLLSQWRSYTPHGKGVSLGLSPSTLNELLRKSQFRIAKCIYEQRGHVELAFGLVNKMMETFRQRLPTLDTSQQHSSQKYHGFLEEFRGELLPVLSIIKHSAFEEECEWRIVSRYFPKYTVPEVKFREGASMLMPYIEIDLPADGLLFDEVILGPTEHNNLSLSALSTYLSNRKVCNVTSSSTIPYREW